MNVENRLDSKLMPHLDHRSISPSLIWTTGLPRRVSLLWSYEDSSFYCSLICPPPSLLVTLRASLFQLGIPKKPSRWSSTHSAQLNKLLLWPDWLEHVIYSAWSGLCVCVCVWCFFYKGRPFNTYNEWHYTKEKDQWERERTYKQKPLPMN